MKAIISFALILVGCGGSYELPQLDEQSSSSSTEDGGSAAVGVKFTCHPPPCFGPFPRAEQIPER